MTFFVGQKVVCIAEPDPERAAFSNSVWTKKGSIYTIRSIITGLAKPITLQRWTMLLFAEIDNSHNDWHGMEPGFESIWFRPIVSRKTDISIFTKMLTPNGVDA